MRKKALKWEYLEFAVAAMLVLLAGLTNSDWIHLFYLLIVTEGVFWLSPKKA